MQHTKERDPLTTALLETPSPVEKVKERLNREEHTSPCSTSPGSSSPPPKPVLKLRSNKKPHIRQTEDILESWEENENGLSWGKKESKDGVWEERWLQQQTQRAAPGAIAGDVAQVNVVFGRSNGRNNSLRQRWTCSWETTTTEDGTMQKIVRKAVEQTSEENKVEEKWIEQIKETRPGNADIWQRKIVKEGRDQRTRRIWAVHTTQLVSLDADKAERIVESEDYIEESFEPSAHSQTPSAASENPASTALSSIHHGAEGTDNVSPPTNDCATSSKGSITVTNSDPSSRPQKETTIKHLADGTVTRQVIVRDESGRTVTKTSDQPNGDYEREERITESSGIVRIRCSKKIGETVTEEHITLDGARRSKNVWHMRGPRRWGEKENEDSQVREDSGKRFTTITTEKWEDDGSEKVVDTWTVEKEHDAGDFVCRLVERGRKLGNRYSDGTEWGETWERVYERGALDESAVEEKPLCPASENCVQNLHLRSRSTDKWWKEPHGNTWGERRYVDLKLSVEQNENWYNNQKEEQHDRWEITEAGERSGEKYGRSASGRREWNEKWSGEAGGPAFAIDKQWAENQEGCRVRWGHCEGHDGSRQWGSRWEEKQGHDGWGTRYDETWNYDAEGNKIVEKMGHDWSSGGTTTNWFKDRYGECSETQEKWAHKEGTNSDGDRWLEKWNETPEQKMAQKSGANARGDEWAEAWHETGTGENRRTWAEKIGKNALGEEWMETWLEHGTKEKIAKKIGKNADEEWEESWGEHFEDDGAGEKWTSKWARNRHTGEGHGHNWGDRWGSEGEGGHRWGEDWHDGKDTNKWAYNTNGRPLGC